MPNLHEILSMPRVAYSLIRFSDPHQREGDSKRRQSEFAPRWCKEHGVRLDDSLSMFIDGQSAFRGHHRQHTGPKVRPLAEFLDLIKSGHVTKGSILIMENLDRLSREEIDEAWQFFRSILKSDIDVVTESPERHYTKESLKDLFSILEVKFVMYRAHDESLQKSRRVRAAWEKKKQRAAEIGEPVSHSCPAWIRLGDDGKYHLIPERANIVKRIFQMAVGIGLTRTVRILKQESVPCFGRKGKWLVEYIRVILRNSAAYGAYEVGKVDPESGRRVATGEVIRNYYPAAVSEATWESARAATRGRYLSSGRPGANVPNLFTGILYDADSRERMHLRPSCRCSRNSKFYKSYKYLVPHRSSCCFRLPYQLFEDGIVRNLSGLKSEDVLPPSPEIDSRLCRLSDLTQEVHSLADRLATLEGQQNDPDTDCDLLPSVQRGIIEVTRRHKEKAKELKLLEEEVHTNRTKLLGACQSALTMLDTPERRLIGKTRIRQLVESIWIVIQPVSRYSRIVHVQIYLRGGIRVYRPILPPNPPPGLLPWPLGDCDFRAGDVGHAARNAAET